MRVTSVLTFLVLLFVSPQMLHAELGKQRAQLCPVESLRSYFAFKFQIDDRSQRNLIARRLRQVPELQPNLALDFVHLVYKHIPSAAEVLYQASAVLTHAQVKGGADWMKFLLVTKRATAVDLGNMLHELSSARHLLNDLPENQYIDLGGDSLRTERGKSSTLAKPGFDLLIRESSTRKLIRQIEVTSVTTPVRNGTDFREAIRHGVEKATGTTSSISGEVDIYFDFDQLDSRSVTSGKSTKFETNGFVRVRFANNAKGKAVRPDQLFHIGSDIIGRTLIAMQADKPAVTRIKIFRFFSKSGSPSFHIEQIAPGKWQIKLPSGERMPDTESP